jgi:hypothetical protein
VARRRLRSLRRTTLSASHASPASSMSLSRSRELYEVSSLLEALASSSCSRPGSIPPRRCRLANRAPNDSSYLSPRDCETRVPFAP